jgi:lysine-ketoglutarate reductase/saccharopine dehydrogenase-like protein (TIGR00300 family)
MGSIVPPDFSEERFAHAPEARYATCVQDGVLPDGFFSTTNLPTYVKMGREWLLPSDPRMDATIVRRPDGRPVIREGRRVRAGDAVALGTVEDGSEGIYVHAESRQSSSGDEEFAFMTSAVSREKPIDYSLMAGILIAERENGGYPVWVTGPALVHSRARADMTWFIANGFVGALLAGNAVAVHDMEASIFGTTLGMSEAGVITQGGHGLHMRAINAVRRAGSIAAAVANGTVTDGIMHACVRHSVPFVLCGSIRDDGPLPDVITDAVAAQDAMRAHTSKATMAIMVATALHAIATGNMLPAFIAGEGGSLRELPTICVDSSEFVVSKLKDRGTRQAFGVVTNAQDFMHILRMYVERELTVRGSTTTGSESR